MRGLKKVFSKNSQKTGEIKAMLASFAVVGLAFLILSWVTPALGFGTAVMIAFAALGLIALCTVLHRRLQNR